MPTVPLDSVARWFPVQHAVTNSTAARSAAAYDAVIDQHDVRTNPRYRPTPSTTFCNIFAGDVMLGMSATLPHWVRPDGTPSMPGDAGAHETLANELYDWLPTVGAKFGWRGVGPQGAQLAANAGCPTVAVWQSPVGRVGHIMVVRPGEWRPGGPWCAQAGTVCYDRAVVGQCLGVREPRYWTAP